MPDGESPSPYLIPEFLLRRILYCRKTELLLFGIWLMENAAPMTIMVTGHMCHIAKAKFHRVSKIGHGRQIYHYKIQKNKEWVA